MLKETKPLVILGFSARAAAECAVQAGYCPTVVDFCGDRDLLALKCHYHSMTNPDWLDWLVEQRTEGPVLLTGGMEHQSSFLYEYFRRSHRSCETIKSVLAMRDSQNWQQWAEVSDIVWPVSISLTNFSSAKSPDFDPNHLGPNFRWVLKSQKSVGGLGVQDWPVDNELSHLRVQNDIESYYLQERLDGIGVGVTFLTSQYGTIPLGVAENGFQDTQSFLPKYTYRGSIGPYRLSEANLFKLKSFAQIAGKESGIQGLWQADFILNEFQIALLEINPRWSASMEILDVAFNERLVAWHGACLDETVEMNAWIELTKRSEQRIQEGSKQVFGKWIRYAPHEFIVSETESSRWWEARWNSGQALVQGRSRFEADIPGANTKVAGGQPIRTTMVVGNSREQVIGLGIALSSHS